MDRNLFLARLRDEVLIVYGVVGTLHQANWLKAGQPPELLNFEKPGSIFRIHRESIRAGADVIVANTLRANRFQLTQLGLEKETRRINLRGVEIAKKASNGRASIAVEIGPI